MKLYIDMIAFYLQKAGGITVVWKELITRMLRDKLDIVLILQGTKCDNIYLDQIMEMTPQIVYEKPRKISVQRYLPVKYSFAKEDIFVSTYYRVPHNKSIRQFTIVHDFTYEYYVKGIKKILHSWQKKQSVKYSQVIVCVSNNTKEDLLKFYPWASEKEIHVIYNGVSEVYKHVENVGEIASLGKYNQEPFFLFLGSRAKYKRFDFAVDVAAKYKYGLVIIGGGELKELEVENLKNKLSNSYLQLLGLEDEELNLIYNKAFALLYPSEYEGFGIPIIEAQKAGCPVVARAGSSVSEIMSNHEILMQECKLEEAERIMNCYKLTENLITEGYENAEKFSWKKTYQEYRKRLLIND